MALHCEAKPVIGRYRLKRLISSELFPIFSNKDNSINLIVSGIGKIKSAVATTFLHLSMFGDNHEPLLNPSFLNLGIAGSSQFPLKKAILVHKVIDQSTGFTWYPFISPLYKKPQGVLYTHDKPQIEYPELGMVDMEGSSFFQTAVLFTNQEQIQILKIISDNDFSTYNQINKVAIEGVIDENIHEIERVVDYLLDLSAKEADFAQAANSDGFLEFQKKWHFTHSQSIQLKECLRKWKLQINDENPIIFCQHANNANEVISKLVNKIKEVFVL